MRTPCVTCAAWTSRCLLRDKIDLKRYLNILATVQPAHRYHRGFYDHALFYVTLKMAGRSGRWSDPDVFRAFRENFKPATKLRLILLAVGSFWLRMALCCAECGAKTFSMLIAVLIGAAILYGIVLLYAFPLLARFENTTFGILKTAFLVGVGICFAPC